MKTTLFSYRKNEIKIETKKKSNISQLQKKTHIKEE